MRKTYIFNDEYSLSCVEIGKLSWSEWKSFTNSDVENVPQSSGVYRLDTVAETLYIGKTDNLRRRLMEHLNSDDTCIKKATVFKYMATTAPERTEDSLLKDYKKRHGKLPECNEKED